MSIVATTYSESRRPSSCVTPEAMLWNRRVEARSIQPFAPGTHRTIVWGVRWRDQAVSSADRIALACQESSCPAPRNLSILASLNPSSGESSPRDLIFSGYRDAQAEQTNPPKLCPKRSNSLSSIASTHCWKGSTKRDSAASAVKLPASKGGRPLPPIPITSMAYTVLCCARSGNHFQNPAAPNINPWTRTIGGFPELRCSSPTTTVWILNSDSGRRRKQRFDGSTRTLISRTE
mmetsp:Transcript_57495/g.122315  ORF Transcript_57495/g.122315 Transcript_57495/m.122315 type:complete len:234 (+) Transcript_57495:325-1026(+)